MSASGHQLVGGFFVGLQIGVIGFGGRKDCFPGADGSTITGEYAYATPVKIYGADGITELIENESGLHKISIQEAGVINGNTSQIYAIKNPLTFITNTIEPQDWYTQSITHQDDNLWSSLKTDYDPCPRGWYVPQRMIWTDFSMSTFPFYVDGEIASEGNYAATNGRLYAASQAWYPPAGAYYYNGVLRNIGYNGVYWSCNVINDFNAKSLNFYMDFFYLNNVGHVRAFGFSIRCVQE